MTKRVSKCPDVELFWYKLLLVVSLSSRESPEDHFQQTNKEHIVQINTVTKCNGVRQDRATSHRVRAAEREEIEWLAPAAWGLLPGPADPALGRADLWHQRSKGPRECQEQSDSLTLFVEILTCVTPTETNLQPARLKVYKSAMQTSQSHQQDLLNCRNWHIYKPKSLCSTFLTFLVLSLTFWTAPAERLWPSPLYYHSETQLSMNRGKVVFLLWHLF